MPTATETIERLTSREYEYGFVTDIEQDSVPPGLDEGVIRLISAKKEEPEWLLEWRLEAYRQWLTMKEPTWPNVTYEPIDYNDIIYFSAPKSMKDRPKSLDDVDPELVRTYEKLGIPLHEQQMLAGVAVDAVFDSVSVATTFRSKLAELGGEGASRAGSQVSRQRRAAQGQLLLGAELGGLLGRLVRLHPEGCSLSDGALHLLPHQRPQHRPVRAHPDRRRGGLLRQLPRGLHRPDARREPAARRGRRARRSSKVRRSSTRRSRTGTPATRTARAGSTTSSPSAASAPAPGSKISWTRWRPDRRSPGSTRAAS